MGIIIVIDKYSLYYKEVPSSLKDYLDNLKGVYYIPQQVYDEAKSEIGNTCRIIMEEMKQCVSKIENG